MEIDTYMARLDTEFLFECSARFLTGERSERVRYKVEHSMRNPKYSTHGLTNLWDKSNYDENFPTIEYLTDTKLQPEARVSSLQYAFCSHSRVVRRLGNNQTKRKRN